MDPCTFTVLSVCTGGGGLDLGLGLAVPNARIVCCIENEAFACEVLATQMEEGMLDEAPVWTDLKTFDGEPWREIVDCVIGGFPCQPHSVSGKKQGKDDPRNLWPEMARILSEVRPPFVFLENVPNLLRTMYREVGEDLCKMGYRVEQGVFSAEEVGASHLRKRLFILGYNDSFEMANSQGRRRGVLREPPERQRQPDRDDQDVDYAMRGRHRGQEEEVRSRGNTSLDAGGDLADSRGGLIQEQGRGQEGGGGSRPEGQEMADPKGLRGEKVVRDEQDRILQTMGYPDGAGLQVDKSESRDIRQERKATERAGRRVDGYEFPLFPPGPKDKEGWQQVHRFQPALEPAVCIMVDELAIGVEQSVLENRTDQLRLLGNGVVPTCAAFAFGVLLDRLFGPEGEKTQT